MKEKFRPYKNESNIYLIDELYKLNDNSGLVYWLIIASIAIGLLWVYLRVGFWIFIILLSLFFIFTITDEDKYNKKKLIIEELDIRN